MEVVIIIIVLVIVYIFSFWAMWKWTQIAHSKVGIYEHFYIDSIDFIVLFIPLINTLLAIIYWISDYPKRRYYKDRQNFLNKFFKIKE